MSGDPKKNKKNQGGNKSVNKTVKVNVIRTGYLDHHFSPHVVDLKGFAPAEKPEFFIAAEPADNYFANQKVSQPEIGQGVEAPVEEKILQEVADVKEEVRNLAEVCVEPLAEIINSDEEIKEQISALRQEIAEMEAAEAVNWSTAEAFKEKASLPEIEPAGEESVTFQVKKVSYNPFTLTKKVVVYMDNGVNRLVDPFRRLPLSARSKAFLGFMVFAFLLILPLSGLSYYRSLQNTGQGIISEAKAAAADLGFAGSSASNTNFAAASAKFNSAQQKFSQAADELNGINKVVIAIASLIPSADKPLETANALLKIGQDLSAAGQSLTVGLAGWEEKDKPLGEKVTELKNALEKANPLIQEINQLAAKVDPGQLPEEERAKFEKINDKLPLLAASFNNFVDLSSFAEKILGQKELKRYLLLFQNNHEIRPSGGFIGSYALVDLINGEIKNIEIPGGGSYDLQGSLAANVAAPAPLRLINPRWEFQDSNWFSDFPATANKAIWFYNQSGGPTVDGVIAINADLLAELLKIIGPVQAGTELVNSDNFFDVTQRQVEVEYDKAKNQPKEFIANLAPEILSQALTADKEKLLAMASLISRSLESKDLQLYLTNSETEKQLTDLGWSNAIKQTTGDYLSVVNANIAGQKTDAVISQQIFHQATILPDGTVRDRVSIIRKHEGLPEQQFYGARNVNYLRLYVPAGSKLISASGLQEPDPSLFKEAGQYQQDQDLVKISGLATTDEKTGVRINQEFGKTVFGGWTQVYPGKTVVTTFEYELPFKVSFAKYQTSFGWLNQLEEKLNLTKETANYQLVIQKQSGSSSEFYSLVDFPGDWQKAWQYPNELKVAAGGINYSGWLDKDRVYSVMFTK